MYSDAMQGVHEHLIYQTPNEHLTYIAELVPLSGADWKKASSCPPQPKHEHLTCFMAGSLMLGATTAHLRPDLGQGGERRRRASIPPRMNELTAEGVRDWKTGAAFLETCMGTHGTATDLSPEGVHFRTTADPKGERDWYIKGANPEIAESVFLAWRLTRDPRYRTHAWSIFSAIETHCRLPGGGYATVKDMDHLPVEWLDKQESFFLSETLKYLLLTFADESMLDLKKVVFNTEHAVYMMHMRIARHGKELGGNGRMKNSKPSFTEAFAKALIVLVLEMYTPHHPYEFKLQNAGHQMSLILRLESKSPKFIPGSLELKGLRRRGSATGSTKFFTGEEKSLIKKTSEKVSCDILEQRLSACFVDFVEAAMGEDEGAEVGEVGKYAGSVCRRELWSGSRVCVGRSFGQKESDERVKSKKSGG
ncbi:glycoside hydrolase [Mycena galopus ATCC 62051]|nr:glycoside hydrolase [Mycena galopus ATCC 62051]